MHRGCTSLLSTCNTSQSCTEVTIRRKYPSSLSQVTLPPQRQKYYFKLKCFSFPKIKIVPQASTRRDHGGKKASSRCNGRGLGKWVAQMITSSDTYSRGCSSSVKRLLATDLEEKFFLFPSLMAYMILSI